MADEQYHDFDEQAVTESMAAVQEHGGGAGGMEAASAGGPQVNMAETGEMFVAAQCVSITVQNNQVCLNLPLGIGKVCLPIPKWIPNGAKLEACIGLCYTWKIPTGVKVTVTFNGKVIVQKSWGKC